MLKNPEEKLVSFFLKYKKVVYKKGQIILRSEDIPSGVYFLYSGFVKDLTLSASGKSLTLILFKEHDIFPYSWTFDKIPNKHTFEAFTDCVLLRAPREELLRFILENPEVLFMITQKILVRFSGVLQRMEYLAFGSAYQKTASILAILAERFGIKNLEGVLISVPLSHKDLAEFIGITRETASIELKKLEKKGIIERKSKQYLVKNIPKLISESALF